MGTCPCSSPYQLATDKIELGLLVLGLSGNFSADALAKLGPIVNAVTTLSVIPFSKRKENKNTVSTIFH